MIPVLKGNNIDDLFLLADCKSRRVSSYDRSGGNHDWFDIPSGATVEFASITGCGIIRHIWCTHWTGDADWKEEAGALRNLILRVYWDGDSEPAIEAPLGDFFGIGGGMRRNYSSMAFSMSPDDGRGMSCFFPMPFARAARFTLENTCTNHTNFYFYIDYEQYNSLPDEDIGYFHARFSGEAKTDGWAPAEPGLLDREKANVPDEPSWLPAAWMRKNTDGKDNYVILDTTGRGKYVGCNLCINVTEAQCNEWYGEGDDMIFIDGEPWPPSLHGTGTEDYFGTAFCPSEEFFAPWHGISVYSGDKEKKGYKFHGMNCMYRLHIHDPIYFSQSIKVTIEHGHANKLSNLYSSTAYWYELPAR